MLAGMVILEDVTIIYSQSSSVENTIDYKVIDTLENIEEKFTDIPSEDFFKALSIAVHSAGMPDYKIDYESAEKIMGDIRWIP